MDPASIPPAYVEYVSRLESGGSAAARNGRSSATGQFQFLKGTWEALRRDHPELHLTPDGRNDPVQSRRAFVFYTAANGRYLKKRLGRDPSFSELWLAHFFGPSGAARLLTAGDKVPLVNALSPDTIRSNSYLLNLKTVGGLRAWARGRIPDDLPGTAFALNTAELDRLRKR